MPDQRKIDPESIRAYVGRDWSAARAAKDRYWRERLDRLGLREVLQVSAALRDWMQTQVPGWPTKEDREEDFETHTRVTRALKKVVVTKTKLPARARARSVR